MYLEDEDLRALWLTPGRKVYDNKHERLGLVDAVNLHHELYYSSTERQAPHVLYMQHIKYCLPVFTPEERNYWTQAIPRILNGTHYITEAEAIMHHNAMKKGVSHE